MAKDQTIYGLLKDLGMLGVKLKPSIFTKESTSWTVNHNLGYNPVVNVLNEGGETIDAQIIHTSNNQFIVYFTVPMKGAVIYR